MAPTIMEIAKRLNISHTTVSRVLNNRSQVPVADKTRQRVLQAAREMGYEPNLAARSLREARTGVIAVFGSAYVGLWGGITPEIVRGISRVLHAHHYGLVFALPEPDDTDQRVISAWRFDGALILQSLPETTLSRLARSGQPCVCVNGQVEGRSAVLCDEAIGVKLAMEHFWTLGHRRIAYVNAEIWHLPHYSVVERYAAYRTFLAHHDVEPIITHQDASTPSDYVELIRTAIITHRATAVLAYDHVVAVRIMAAASQLGLLIPQDFSLICFNNEFPVEDVFPPLTVVAPDGEEMGRQGSELLLGQLASPSAHAPKTVCLPAQLIVRASTAPPKEVSNAA